MERVVERLRPEILYVFRGYYAVGENRRCSLVDRREYHRSVHVLGRRREHVDFTFRICPLEEDRARELQCENSPVEHSAMFEHERSHERHFLSAISDSVTRGHFEKLPNPLLRCILDTERSFSCQSPGNDFTWIFSFALWRKRVAALASLLQVYSTRSLVYHSSTCSCVTSLSSECRANRMSSGTCCDRAFLNHHLGNPVVLRSVAAFADCTLGHPAVRITSTLYRNLLRILLGRNYWTTRHVVYNCIDALHREFLEKAASRLTNIFPRLRQRRRSLMHEMLPLHLFWSVSEYESDIRAAISFPVPLPRRGEAEKDELKNGYRKQQLIREVNLVDPSRSSVSTDGPSPRNNTSCVVDDSSKSTLGSDLFSIAHEHVPLKFRKKNVARRRVKEKRNESLIKEFLDHLNENQDSGHSTANKAQEVSPENQFSAVQVLQHVQGQCFSHEGHSIYESGDGLFTLCHALTLDLEAIQDPLYFCMTYVAGSSSASSDQDSLLATMGPSRKNVEELCENVTTHLGSRGTLFSRDYKFFYDKRVVRLLFDLLRSGFFRSDEITLPMVEKLINISRHELMMCVEVPFTRLPLRLKSYYLNRKQGDVYKDGAVEVISCDSDLEDRIRDVLIWDESENQMGREVESQCFRRAK